MTRQITIVAVALIALVVADSAMAQTNLQNATQSFGSLLELIRNSAYSWSIRLQGYAVRLFWGLAVIQLVWTMFPLVMKQADFGEIAGELLRYVMVIGFFAALLLYSVEWATAVVNSFRQAGASAAGMPIQLHPGDMFGLAVQLAETVSDFQTINPLVAVMVGIAAILVLLCFAFIAAFMALTLIESYIVINASVLFMGFGGSQWTREYATSLIRYAVSVGAKLFVLTLIVGLIMESARQWQAAYTHDQTSMWVMVGLAFVCAYLSKTIPEQIQALINGVSTSGGSVLGGMAAAGVAGAAAAIATVSAASSSGMGGMLGSASDALKSSSGGGESGGSPMSSMTGGSGGGSGGGGSGGPSSRTGGGNGIGSGLGSAPGPAPGATPGATSGGGSNAASSATPKGGGVGAMAHAAMASAGHTLNTLSALSVPGMESVASTPIGSPPFQPSMNSDLPPSMGETPENIIRPESATVAAAPDVPAQAQAASPMIDTMSSLQEALNKGKL